MSLENVVKLRKLRFYKLPQYSIEIINDKLFQISNIMQSF